MNVDERVLSESVWREWVQRAFDVDVKLINEIKLLFYQKLDKNIVTFRKITN